MALPYPSKSRTWDLGTSANGTFFDTEFNQIYSNLTYLLNPVNETGKVLQVAYAETAASTTGSTVMVYDDTIPQNTEGDEFLTCAITPKSATSKLIVESAFFGGEDSNVSASIIIGALFRDTTVDAIAAVGVSPLTTGQVGTNIEQSQIYLCAQVTSGSTSATTFKLRAGLAGAGSSAGFRINGADGGRKLGGALKTYIKITEVAA